VALAQTTPPLRGRLTGGQKMKQKVYEADCIEHGERFYTLFKTTETNPLKLKIRRNRYDK